MPGGGAKPGERRGGRAPGTPNKTTAERRLKAELEANARKAELKIIEAKAATRKLAKEHMQDFIPVLAGMAAYYQPTFPGMAQQNPNGNPAQFERWFGHFLTTARTLAPFESPTFRAIDMRATLPSGQDTSPLEIMRAMLDEIDDEARSERAQMKQIEHSR